MDEQFKLLDSNEVVTVDSYYQIVISHSTFRVGEFTEALKQDLRSFVTANYSGKQEQHLQKGWFEEGTGCEILRLGAKDWQKGKVKIRVSLDFCPDEPAAKETPNSNEPEITHPESPLDDIRRIMNENS